MLRRRLDSELHGGDGYTTWHRMFAVCFIVGFFVVGSQLLMKSWFDGRILPGVVVADHQVGGWPVRQVRTMLQREVAAYRFKLAVADRKFDLSATDLGVTFDVEATLANAYDNGRQGYLPPVSLQPVDLVYHLDRTTLASFAADVAAQIGTPPTDAGVVVKAGKFQTIPEKSGWSIDKLGLVRLIENDMSSPAAAQLTLRPREQVADIQVSDLTPTVEAAQQLTTIPIKLTYHDQSFSPSATDIGSWLTFVKQTDTQGSRLVPQVDVSKVKNYVQGVANTLAVAPVNKKVTVENGVSKTETEGADGSAIDQDPITTAISDALSKQIPLEFAITSHTVAFKTISTNVVSLDLGRYVEVNLSAQHLWVWENHQVIFDAPITSGATGAGLGTVTGLFSIYYKTTNTHLVGYQYGYNYDVAVKYWMPFYKGYGLHDASWRNGKFGGPDYYYGGSHGCVNLPDAAAEFIYNWSTVGTPVWVHN